MEIPTAPVLPATTGKPLNTYLSITRTATYSFLFSLPLLILYEVLIQLVNGGQMVQIRVSADVWIKSLLGQLGAHGSLFLTAFVILVGIAIVVYERKKRIPMRPYYFGLMLAESVVYAVAVAGLVSGIVGFLFAMAVTIPGPIPAAAPPQLANESIFTQLALSIGAGIYEELLFRVILVGGMYWILKRILKSRGSAYVIAALVGAFLFSLVHYIGAMGDPFLLSSFTFRFLFGLFLNVLYLVRGFGIAAWTHSIYDVLVVTHLLG